MTKPNRSARRPGPRPVEVRCSGFTLIELITVIIILGLLSTVIWTRSPSLSGDLTARLSEVRSQLRYVQLAAMKNNVSYLGLQSDGTNYWAQNINATSGTASYLALPGETSAVISLSGKSMQSNSFDIRFDNLGIPYDGGGNKLTSATSIIITAGGSSGTLTVAPETGFVQ